MILIAFRAYAMPITHDEVSTWYHYLNIDLFSCFTNPSCWGTANNHWLNSLLMQVTTSVFGDGVLALRIPNVLAGWLYLICAILFCARFIKSSGLQLAGFLLLSSYMYLLDFFSLARGYGLMASGILWSVFSLLMYFRDYRAKWLIVCIVSVILAVLSNFTALLSYVVIGGTWVLWLLISRRQGLLLRHGLYWLASALILILALYSPIKTLAANGEFTWGAANVYETGIDLFTNLLYNEKYFGNSSAQIFMLLLMAVNLMVFAVSFYLPGRSVSRPIQILFTMLVLNVVLIIANQMITGAFAPVGRKSIYLIPFIFSIPALGLAYLEEKAAARFAGFALAALLVFHFISTVRIRSNREWYYDAYYPQLFSVVFPEGSSSDSVRMSSSWIFNPALVYYQKTIPLPVSGLPYQKELQIDTSMQYYYLDPPDTVGMVNAGFRQEQMIGHFFLYKNTRHQ